MNRESIHILIVEDNAGDADMTSELLAEAAGVDLEVSVAPTLASATKLLRETTIDVVVVDLNLPDSTGLDTLVRLRTVQPIIPMVVVSGAVDGGLREAALREGAEEVISKAEANSRLFALSVLYVIERNRAEEQSKRLERFLEVSPDAVIVVDGPGHVKYVNDAATRLFGRAREEFAESLLSFSAPEGQPVELRFPRDAAGGERVGEMRVVDFEWRGKRSTLAAIRDVTEQKKMEMQLVVSDRMVSIGTLAAGVAHEINNPLAAVIANLELAIQDLNDLSKHVVVPTDVLDELRDAREAAERVRHIVRDLKIFSRPEEDKLGPVDVHRVLESTLRMAWNEVRHRARLVRDFAVPSVPLVTANESRLGQVFLNLVVNAAQAIREGAADQNEVRVTTRRDGARVLVTISDSGEGIPVAVRNRLFTPFFTTKPIGEGTGLGLAICHRIVSGLGGEITFETAVGSGTRFIVSLPAAPPEVSSIDQAKAVESQRKGLRARILAIDDEVTIVRIVERILGAEHDVVGVQSAREALAMIAEGRAFDLFLCDLMMPELSAMDFYARVCELGCGLEHRIVFITGGAFTVGARNFLDTVPNQRIEKPFDASGLRALVRTALQAQS